MKRFRATTNANALRRRNAGPYFSGYSSVVQGPGWQAYTFTSNGQFNVPQGAVVDILLVGGGGGASGYIGGGGGGGYYTYQTSQSIPIGSFDIAIGVGGGGTGEVGTSDPAPTNGGNTTLVGGTLSLTGLGGTGAQKVSGVAGSSGPYTGGIYYDTGIGLIGSGGGGGASQNGTDGSSSGGGNGGNGFQCSITGSAVYYGGGGGGGWYGPGTIPGTGGLGGGASGSPIYNPSSQYDGTNGLGGGGGGGSAGGFSIGGNGGSGVAIVRIYS